MPIMKTLKELKEKCNLIAEFKNPNYIGKHDDIIYHYGNKIKTALYGDNKGKYYHYKYINKGEIIEYDNYELAVERYIKFIDIILTR